MCWIKWNQNTVTERRCSIDRATNASVLANPCCTAKLRLGDVLIDLSDAKWLEWEASDESQMKRNSRGPEPPKAETEQEQEDEPGCQIRSGAREQISGCKKHYACKDDERNSDE